MPVPGTPILAAAPLTAGLASATTVRCRDQTLGSLCAPVFLVGLGASAAAAYTHYHLLSDPAYRSFCDVNETISCTQVYMSRFSTIRGIPVALFGATGRCRRGAVVD